MREYAFELALCAAREQQVEGLLARQLGASAHGGRVMDVVELAPGPAFEERLALASDTIPAPVLRAPLGPGTARDPSVVDCHPDRREEVVDAAVEAGYLERERRGGRTLVRATGRYPEDWFGRLRGVENKPDLGRPGDLDRQLRTDASLALLDEVVLATASHVTGAHLNRLPDPVGVWRFDPETGTREVVREPSPLPVDDPGVEPLDRHPGRTDVAVVDTGTKRRLRRRLAERVLGKGWRPDAAAWPDCARVRVGEPAGRGPVPDCAWKGRVVDPAAECGPACEGFDPADAPAVDPRAARAEATPWDPDAGGGRRQTGLDRFGDSG